MCEPVSIAEGVILVAGAVYGAAKQNQATKMANTAATNNYNTQMGIAQRQEAERSAQYTRQKSQIAQELDTERNNLTAIAADTNTAGGSLDRISDSIDQQAGGAMDAAATNFENQGNAMYDQRQSMRAQVIGENKVRIANGPSWVGLGLQVAGIALGGVANAQQSQRGQQLLDAQKKQYDINRQRNALQ